MRNHGSYTMASKRDIKAVINGPADLRDRVTQWLDSATPAEIGDAVVYGWAQLETQKSLGGMTREQMVPVARGKLGEEHVEEILRRNFGAIENTSGAARSGDLTLFYRGRKTLIEVKNYKTAVPSSQVDKFRRDLEASCAEAGVFISLGCPIAGVRQSFALAYENVGGRVVPVVYLCSDSEDILLTAVSVVAGIAEWKSAQRENMREVVSAAAIDLFEGVDGLARARHTLQSEIAGVSGRLMGRVGDIIEAEADLRRVALELKRDTTVSAPADVDGVMTELRANQHFMRCSQDARDCAAKIVAMLQQPGELFANAWRISAKKCTHVRSRVSLEFAAGCITIGVPVDMLTRELVMKVVEAPVEKNITKQQCGVVLDSGSERLVAELLGCVACPSQ